MQAFDRKEGIKPIAAYRVERQGCKVLRKKNEGYTNAAPNFDIKSFS
jgi:hypothetical protein